jgi:hypothetical protein
MEIESMGQPAFPSLYQLNTRVWLHELSQAAGRPVTLAQVGDEVLEYLAAQGFDGLWLMGVWQTGLAGRDVSRRHPGWRRDFETLLPDLSEEDIVGSPFAVQKYTVHADYGGDEALARLRQRLRTHGIHLLLDFVPNHTAPDHPWVWQHPEYYIGGDETDLARTPYDFRRVDTRRGPRILACGQDPSFPPWPDTLQLNYRCQALRQAMLGELSRLAGQCDGLRCDMSMLLLPEVIERTWGDRSLPRDGTPPQDESFWPEAIAHVRRTDPEFRFLAEVYWDLEWTLQQQGFDYTYDKRLYDRLQARDPEAVRGHLDVDAGYQGKMVRFLENHDEPRAASAFPPGAGRAAAMITYLVPGLRLFHDGQLEGRRQRTSLHLRRRAAEPVDAAVHEFYRALLDLLKRPLLRDGQWQLLECRPAWPDNPTWRNFLTFRWEGPHRERMLVTINYGYTQGQCYLPLPWTDLQGNRLLLRDLTSATRYEREGNELIHRGLYLDLPEWHYHVFELRPL